MWRRLMIGVWLPLAATQGFAQAGGANGPMSEAQIRQLQQQAEQMQQCFQQVDQGQLQAMMAEGQQLQEELKSLCAAGQRDAALSKAMAYGQEMGQSEVMKTMQRCGEMMQQQASPSIFEQARADPGEPGYRHICDAM